MKIYSAILLFVATCTFPSCSTSLQSSPTAKDNKPNVKVGASYEEAKIQLTSASIAKTGGGDFWSGDYDVVLEFFHLDKNAELVIGRSLSTNLVKTLSIYYIPSDITSESQFVNERVRSIEFMRDKSYIVHFEVPKRASH